jgi:hypothetical protein
MSGPTCWKRCTACSLDWRGEEPQGEKPFFTIPMFSERGGKVTARFVSTLYYKSASRFGDEYAPTPLQLEALETVQEVANRPEVMLSMDFQEGDIQLLNNHTTPHVRTAYACAGAARSGTALRQKTWCSSSAQYFPWKRATTA